MTAERPLRRICVFCGASAGRGPHYAVAAALVGESLAERGIELVYGGSAVGLMGVVADGALAAGGRVTGVIPAALVESKGNVSGRSSYGRQSLRPRDRGRPPEHRQRRDGDDGDRSDAHRDRVVEAALAAGRRAPEAADTSGIEVRGIKI